MRIQFLKTYYNAYLQNPVYPNSLINGGSPYDERIMSMPTLMNRDGERRIKIVDDATVSNGTYFFFIFNFENYYHFLYDTLPYLYFYFSLPTGAKLLLPENHKLLKFQSECLDLLGLTDHIEFARTDSIYETLYVPSSLTHGQLLAGGHASNTPPSAECAAIWSRLSKAVLQRPVCCTLPKRIYISRRTHLHGDSSNIGTNYTTRRRCINEDDVVGALTPYGFTEVFCELLSTEEKIQMFHGATHIVGFIGGGMANTLFSQPSAVVGCIVTPEFLTINSRFRYSMTHTCVDFLEMTALASHSGPYPLYVRVNVIDKESPYFNKIGEIDTFLEDCGKYIIKFAAADVAGFSLHGEFVSVQLQPSQFTAIDGGLNSPFICDINSLRKYLDEKAK